MSSPSLPTARLPLRPSPAAATAPLSRRGAPARSLAASPAPAVALKPLVSKAPASGSYRSALLLHRRRRYALPETAVPEAAPMVTKEYQDWDSLTGKFAGSANVPFLLLQLPQIILNYRNLVDGNKTALYAVPWLGMLTGLLGNLALVSYFAKKRETEAVIVQTLGVISTYVVILQLAMAESMPFPQFVATSAVVGAGLVLNLLNYIGWLPETLWLLWEDFTTVGGLTVLPQVMWSTFVPVIPSSILPGIICGSLAVAAVAMARMGKLSEGGTKFVGSLSGWTATLLFMWMPVAQMWTNYLNPSNIEGLSAFSMLLSMIGNALMIPRSVFIRDLMWFTGSIWACALQGWGNLACMYCCNSISREFFLATTFGLLLWLGFTFGRDTEAFGNSSPMDTLKELICGK
ncbi:maltose excess protein 1-like, chloroplastic [Triticum dicoccoides]|uniref:maltose excess protein 1-like, chloroplastic n=1 Tax=Triticum dicoccoides TaxID=85692 RepID=UPI00188E837C|nr:maltose excess protein 1-like, chloroplastic [Triticum dicoccoides]